MKKFFDKFFRKDLELNKKWWHRAIKVVRIIFLLIALIVVIIEFKPYFSNEIEYQGTIIGRVPSTGYYKIGKLIKDGEYWSNSKLSTTHRRYDDNMKILEDYSKQDQNIFCSNNWNDQNFNDLCNKYKIFIMSGGGYQGIVSLTDSWQRIKKPCVGIENSTNYLIINYDSDVFNTGGYIYTIKEPNYLFLCITRIAKVVGAIAIIISISLIIYYLGIIYIIYGNKKNKK